MSSVEATNFGISESQRRRYFRVDASGNMFAPANGAVWREIVSGDAANGTGNQPSDNVGVVTEWKPPSALDGLTTTDLVAVQKLCRLESGGTAPRPMIGWAR
jgi:hypothetical protein